MCQAMLEVFPNAEVRHCLYHFCRSLFGRIRKEGLLPLYSIPKAKELLRSLMSLAFVPLNEVFRGYSAVGDALANLLKEAVIPMRFAVPIHSTFFYQHVRQ